MSDQLRQYIRIKPAVSDGGKRLYNVFLRVDNQSFYVTRWPFDKPEDAEWIANMLHKALEKIVDEETKGLRPV